MDGTTLARRFFFAGISAGMMASIGFAGWWQSGWEETAPRAPDPVHHLVVPINQHGVTIYLTPFQSTVHVASGAGMVVMLALTFLLLPRGHRLGKSGDADPGGQWERGAVAGFAVGVLLVWLAGRALVRWLNAQGVVLHG